MTLRRCAQTNGRSLFERRARVSVVVLAALFTIGLGRPAWAQGWSVCGGTDLCATSSAYVGIGPIANGIPQWPLHVSTNSSSMGFFFDAYASSSPNPALIFRAARGTSTSPSAVQSGDLLGTFGARAYGATSFVSSSSAAAYFVATENWTDSNHGTALVLATTMNGTGTRYERMRIDNTGNIGIGNFSTGPGPQHPLQVLGTIGAEEVIVSSTGADYVFQPGYALKPLAEVGEYIQQNRHLPDIPSAKEVEEKGVNLGEMQTKLLAKIEELTLHAIQQEKENRDLRERVARLEARDGTAAKEARP